MNADTGIVTGVSVSHERASVEDIETASASSTADRVAALLDRPVVEEAFVLQTCNRAEAYVVTDGADAGREALAPGVEDVPDDVVRWLDHEGSLRHLMRVAAGLESLVVGEDQILGQVRDAYELAREEGAVGPVLDDALLKALHVGERARAETAINEGVVSLGSAAVRLAAEERDLADATAVVVGAGEMATLVAKALDGTVSRIVVANRTAETADHVAEAVGTDAQVAELDDLGDVVEKATLVVSATGSDGPVVDRDDLAGAGDTLVLDIAQPRDVAPSAAALDPVEVHDLDALEDVRGETLSNRREAADAVEAMIDEEFDHLMAQYKRKRADRVIAAMHRGAERVKSRELNTALSKMESEGELTDEQREAVESMADALVSQLLAAPTRSLRDAAEEDDWSTIHTALQLFDPSATDESGEPSPDDIPDEMRAKMPSAVLEQLKADED